MQNRGGTPSVQMQMCSTDLSHHPYEGGTSSVWMRVCNTEEAHHQYGCGYRLRKRHTIGADACVQHGSVTSSVRRSVCTIGLTNCSGGCWCWYLPGIMILYKQSYYNLEFILLLLYPDVAKIPLAPYHNYARFHTSADLRK